MVPGRRDMSRLHRVASLAPRFRMPPVRDSWPLADGRRAVLVRTLPIPDIGDHGDHLPPHPYPLMVWFAAAWYMTSAKNGVSAKTLHRLLGFGSYQTAWTMLHRFRTAMVRPGRDLLTGDVEVDETFIGGIRPGKRGRGAEGKTLVAVAVELLNPKGLRAVPPARHSQRSGADAALVPARLREAGLRRCHRWVVLLPDCHGGRLHAQAPFSGQLQRPGPCVFAWGSPRRQPPQTMAARDPSRGRGGGSPPSVPRRVRLPLQPAPLGVPGPPFSASPRTSGPSGARVLSVPRRKPITQAHEAPTAHHASDIPFVIYWDTPCTPLARPQPVGVTALRWIPRISNSPHTP